MIENICCVVKRSHLAEQQIITDIKNIIFRNLQI